MQAHSDWYHRVETEINQHALNAKEAKAYKLDLLLRVAARIDEFSGYCGECQGYQSEVSRLVQELSLMMQMPGRGGLKVYHKMLNEMVSHLQKVHKLVSKGHYLGVGVGIGMAVGAILGTLLGAVFDNTALGTPVGVVIGLIIGRYLDKKAREEGKVI